MRYTYRVVSDDAWMDGQFTEQEAAEMYCLALSQSGRRNCRVVRYSLSGLPVAGK